MIRAHERDDIAQTQEAPEGAAEYTLLSPLRGYRFIYIRKQGFRFRLTPAYSLSPLRGYGAGVRLRSRLGAEFEALEAGAL